MKDIYEKLLKYQQKVLTFKINPPYVAIYWVNDNLECFPLPAHSFKEASRYAKIVTTYKSAFLLGILKVKEPSKGWRHFL